VGLAEVSGDEPAKAFVGEAAGDGVLDVAESAGQSHGALIPEAQGSGSLALVMGLVDALEERRADGTALTGTLDHKQPAVDLAGFGQEFGEVLDAGEHVEVRGLVDDRLDPQRAAVFEVLLDAAVLVAEVDLDLRPGAEDPSQVGVAGRSAQRSGEHERDLFGAADPDVVLNEGLEEAAGAAWVVEHQGATDFDLAHRELPPVAGRAVLGGERRWDAHDPAVEEPLDMFGGEGVAERLQPPGVSGARESVGQRGERDLEPAGLAFGPLVPVEPDLRRVREVGADLDEPRPPVRVQDVEVVDADSTFLAEERLSGGDRR